MHQNCANLRARIEKSHYGLRICVIHTVNVLGFLAMGVRRIFFGVRLILIFFLNIFRKLFKFPLGILSLGNSARSPFISALRRFLRLPLFSSGTTHISELRAYSESKYISLHLCSILSISVGFFLLFCSELLNSSFYRLCFASFPMPNYLGTLHLKA